MITLSIILIGFILVAMIATLIKVSIFAILLPLIIVVGLVALLFSPLHIIKRICRWF